MRKSVLRLWKFNAGVSIFYSVRFRHFLTLNFTQYYSYFSYKLPTSRSHFCHSIFVFFPSWFACFLCRLIRAWKAEKESQFQFSEGQGGAEEETGARTMPSNTKIKYRERRYIAGEAGTSGGKLEREITDLQSRPKGRYVESLKGEVTFEEEAKYWKKMAGDGVGVWGDRGEGRGVMEGGLREGSSGGGRQEDEEGEAEGEGQGSAGEHPPSHSISHGNTDRGGWEEGGGEGGEEREGSQG